MTQLFKAAKKAARGMITLTDSDRDRVLHHVAEAIEANLEMLLSANSQDLAKMEPANPLYDRLLLTEDRLKGIAKDIRNVAALPSPLGIESEQRTPDNGLRLKRVSVPFGVIGIIYEARPNVSFDVFSLCFKSGNVCLLKGSQNAVHSNEAIVELIHGVLKAEGIDTAACTLLPSTHDATHELLNAVNYVDLVIPRGGRKLIDFVRENAHVPVIETGAGVVHAYFDKDGDLEKGRRIITNAKMRRPSVCNSLDCLLVHRDRATDLDALLRDMKGKVEFAKDEYGTEWMELKLSIRIVDSMDEALEHIAQYGSGHSECIITENKESAKRFQQLVDAACVYVNAPTSFTDGAQFGLGAEIGISTQKLGPRGPMGLREITTYKWLIEGEGQTRP